MNERLTLFFSQINPEELDTLLENDFEKEPLAPDCFIRVQTRVLSAVKARHRQRRTPVWAAAAVLALAVGIGGLTVLSGTWPAASRDPVAGIPPIIDRDPSQSESDVFSDPNVLWGSGEDFEIVASMPYGIRFSSELEELLSIAGEQNRIVFRLVPTHCSFPVNADRLVIHEELARYLVDHAESYEIYGYEESAVLRACSADLFLENTHEIGQEMSEILYWTANTLPHENEGYYWYDDPEAEALAMENERYRELSEIWDYNLKIYNDFQKSLYLQETETIRSLFIERGFTPVYKFDFDEAFRNGEAQSPYTERALTFAATAEKILQIEDMVGEYEGGYWIMTAGEDISLVEWPD